MLKKVWNDPVWGSVIAAVIVASAAAVGSYFSGWWPDISQFVRNAYAFASSSTAIPNWLIGVVMLLAIPTIVIAAALSWQAIRPSTLSVVDWRSYSTDIFFNLRWRWKYLSGGQISSMHVFCPQCDFQLFPEDVSAYRAVDHIRFRCDSCHRVVGEFQESLLSLESKAGRFVQQKLRNDSWPRSPNNQ